MTTQEERQPATEAGRALERQAAFHQRNCNYQYGNAEHCSCSLLDRVLAIEAEAERLGRDQMDEALRLHAASPEHSYNRAEAQATNEPSNGHRDPNCYVDADTGCLCGKDAKPHDRTVRDVRDRGALVALREAVDHLIDVICQHAEAEGLDTATLAAIISGPKSVLANTEAAATQAKQSIEAAAVEPWREALHDLERTARKHEREPDTADLGWALGKARSLLNPKKPEGGA